MHTRALYRFVALGLGALIMSACGGRRLGTSWPNMSAADGTLYIANGVAVYALEAESGTRSWRFPVEADRQATQFYGPPTILPDAVVVSSFNQLAFGLNMQGALQWTFDGEPVRTATAPAATSAADGVLYLVADRTLHALNAESGQEMWQFESENVFWAPPASDGERLYQPGMNHALYALDPATGSEFWRQEFDGALASRPTVVDGTIYVGSLSNNAYALEAATGRLRWQVETDGWVWSSPIVDDGRVYFGDLQGSVYAADAETGAIVWKAELDSAVRGAPAASPGGAIFANTEGGSVYSINAADGEVNWQVEIDPNTAERLLATPILTDDLVLIAALNGTHLVYAYDQETGSLAWQFDPDG